MSKSLPTYTFWENGSLAALSFNEISLNMFIIEIEALHCLSTIHAL